MAIVATRFQLYLMLSVATLCAVASASSAQTSSPSTSATSQSAAPKQPQERLRSRIFIYDLREGTSRMVYQADAVWEAPNWSPDGKYLISNSGGAIYKLALTQDGSAAPPQRLDIPPAYSCNNDKALSTDGKKLGFSATLAPHQGSQVFVANADGTNVTLLTEQSPSYFHGWSPDSSTLAFVAQRGGSGQYDVYRVPAAGGPEQQLNASPSQEDGPDYSPDGNWIYVNSTRSGKEAIWRFPSDGAGPKDARAEMVVNDSLEDWFPHISPDGSKMVYIGYPAGTPTHNPRDVRIELKLVTINQDKVDTTQKTLVRGMGGQGTFNVNSWAPDSKRFAYVTYEALP